MTVCVLYSVQFEMKVEHESWCITCPRTPHIECRVCGSKCKMQLQHFLPPIRLYKC